MNYIAIENIKVGIIGGGVMGRLVLNSLLVL
jgi:predicted homoserine dehydrogenase-like protein